MKNKPSTNDIDKRFFYGREIRLAAIATCVTYLSFLALEKSSEVLSAGLITVELGSLKHMFPSSSLISLLVGAFLFATLSEFLNNYFTTY